MIHRWTGTAWRALENGQVDTENRTVSAPPVPVTVAILEVTPHPGADRFRGGPALLRSCWAEVARTFMVTGTGFFDGSVARWNGQNRETTFGSAGSLTVAIPAADLADPGTAQLTVFNPAPGGGTSAAVTITIAAAQPAGAEVTVGQGHACASRADGQAVCWGDNGSGQGGTTGSASSVPVPVSGGLHLTHLTAGSSHTCGLDPAGAAFCWGSNSSGQLGDGSTTNRNAPTPVLGGHMFLSLAGGLFHTCGLTAAGAAWCWGRGSSGQLGTGGTADSPVPAAVSGGHQFTQLATGGSATCGLQGDGAAWCWGVRPHLGIGQVGGGGVEAAPVAVSGGLQFAEISAGGAGFCGRTAGGAAYCWGTGASGQLGNGAAPASAGVPSPVAGGLSFATVAAGGAFACGVTVGGDLYCWGSNTAGQLGDGTIVTRAVPVRALTNLVFTRLRLGTTTACGVTAANDVSCWGSRGFGGQLGDRLRNTQNAPARVSGGQNFASIAAGDEENLRNHPRRRYLLLGSGPSRRARGAARPARRQR
ncbi:MAG: hypothetical protein R2882_13235 [Gemmatimonadales bacterium]